MDHAILMLLKDALIEIRYLIRLGHAEQAGDLADALHNLPGNLAEGKLNLQRLAVCLEEYEEKYKDSERPPRGYVARVRELLQAK